MKLYKSEKYVQTEQGLRIEGRQDLEDGRCITWMRYLPVKTMDDHKRK